MVTYVPKRIRKYCTELGLAYRRGDGVTPPDKPSVQGTLVAIEQVEQWIQECGDETLQIQYFVDGRPVILDHNTLGQITKSLRTTGEVWVCLEAV